MKDSTRAPLYACMYHGLCVTARKHGYALAIHGTVTTDLDLIAVPWTENAVEPEVLKNALMKHINALDYENHLVRFGLSSEEAKKTADKINADKEIKPHGRLAWNLYLEHGCQVDLSIIPPLKPNKK